MYRKIEETLRMTSNEASKRYPSEFILVREDPGGMVAGRMSTVLYVGDNYGELSKLRFDFNELSGCVVIEGRNHRRNDLGGVVVGA